MNITAIIVTCNPPDNFLERLDVISKEVNHLVIIDNASDETVKKTFKEALPHLAGKLEIIWNEENKGLATALNQGIQQALSQDADWILLLDHDSQPEPGMVAHMQQTYDSHPKKETIGLIAPEIKDQNTTSETRYLVPKGKFGFQRITLKEQYNDKVLSVITSGSLINARIFNEIGFMPDHFFIDSIDHAFCLQLKKSGYNIMLVKDAILQHALGDKTVHNLIGAKVITSHHSALRRYYIFRNRIWICKKYIGTFPNFIIHDFLASGLDVFRIFFYETQKWQKIKAILRGICAGLRREQN